MTREEAIQVLQEKVDNSPLFKEEREAFVMAIEALSAEEMMVIQTGQTHGKSAYIKELAEVVRCKDCRYWKNFNNAQGICHERPNIITTEQYNDFCSHGERREE